MIKTPSKLTPVLAGVVLAGILLTGLAACQPQGQGQGQQAAVDTAAIHSKLDSLRSAFEEAYSAGDFETVASVVHPNMVYSPPGRPPIQGRDSIVAYDQKMRPPGASIDIEPIEVRILTGEWAYEIGTSTIRYTPEGADAPRSMEATYLVVLRKTPDGWKTYRESLSTNQPPPGGA